MAQFQKLSTDYCVPKGKGAITVNEYPSAPEVTQALLSNNVQAQVEIAGAAKLIAEKTKGRGGGEQRTPDLFADPRDLCEEGQ